MSPKWRVDLHVEFYRLFAHYIIALVTVDSESVTQVLTSLKCDGLRCSTLLAADADCDAAEPAGSGAMMPFNNHYSR